MNRRCVIFAAGQMDITPLLPRPENGDFIIAADAGIRNASALGVVPDLVMGDMDSADAAEVPKGALLFPVRKDDTDLMLAIKKGIELGYHDFLIYGATGGRLDHTFASIQSLSYLLTHGCRGVLVDGKQWVTLFRDGTVQIPAGYRHVSVFSYTERCRGVTLRGLSYPLEDGELDQDFPLGVSNSMVADSASVSVKEGTLLVILSDYR